MKTVYLCLFLFLLPISIYPSRNQSDERKIPTKSQLSGGLPVVMPFVREQRPYNADDTTFEKARKSLESGFYTLIEAIPSLVIIALLYIGTCKANRYLNQEGH